MDADFPAFPKTGRDAGFPQSLTDAELFAVYLSARLARALEALNQARGELAAQPDNLTRALQVMQRVHQLGKLRGQLETQRAQANSTRSAAGLETATDKPKVTTHATPGDAFRAAQSSEADKIMAALTAKPRTCPSCQALLEPNSTQCHCGYTVDPQSESPHLDTDAQGSTPPPR